MVHVLVPGAVVVVVLVVVVVVVLVVVVVVVVAGRLAFRVPGGDVADRLVVVVLGLRGGGRLLRAVAVRPHVAGHLHGVLDVVLAPLVARLVHELLRVGLEPLQLVVVREQVEDEIEQRTRHGGHGNRPWVGAGHRGPAVEGKSRTGGHPGASGAGPRPARPRIGGSH